MAFEGILSEYISAKLYPLVNIWNLGEEIMTDGPWREHPKLDGPLLDGERDFLPTSTGIGGSLSF